MDISFDLTEVRRQLAAARRLVEFTPDGPAVRKARRRLERMEAQVDRLEMVAATRASGPGPG